MRLLATIKDNRIEDYINLKDGEYYLDIKSKGKTKSFEQVKKLWATIDDISRAEYGDISQSSNIYLNILQMAGIDTYKMMLPEKALDDLKKKTKAVGVISRETINHQPYLLVNVCLVGISEMNKYEVSQVIDCAIRWASELGIETELERNEI